MVNDSVLEWCKMVDNHEDRIHVVLGRTSRSALETVIRLGGVEEYFKGRIFKSEYYKTPCYYVDTPKGEKVILVGCGSRLSGGTFVKNFQIGTAYLEDPSSVTPYCIKHLEGSLKDSSDKRLFGSGLTFSIWKEAREYVRLASNADASIDERLLAIERFSKLYETYIPSL